MKYMGSKARLAKELLPIILADRVEGQWYIEPFVGGMNMICEVTGNRIGNDSNHYLIRMWEKLLSGWIPEPISREDYYNVKSNKENYPDYLVGWIGFNCSYCGVWYGSFAGKVITETGLVRDYQDEAIRNVLKQVKKMEGIILKDQFYWDLEIPQNSVIYCDPPYAGTSGYKDSNFDSEFFWEWVRSQVESGHKVFVSEYNSPPDFTCVWQKKVQSSLAPNGISKASTEKLFTLKR